MDFRPVVSAGSGIPFGTIGTAERPRVSRAWLPNPGRSGHSRSSPAVIIISGMREMVGRSSQEVR